MPRDDKAIPDWDKTFIDRWRKAITREFGSGKVAAHRLAQVGLKPATVKAWLANQGGRPTIANLCLVARAARDPSSFMVEVCGEEPWALELGVAVQRRRLRSAKTALDRWVHSDTQNAGAALRALTGPPRGYWFITDNGVMTNRVSCPEQAATALLDADLNGRARRSPALAAGLGEAVDTALSDLGWILIEETADDPLIVRCHAIRVSDRAGAALARWLQQDWPQQERSARGVVVRTFLTGWVDLPCATAYQVSAELDRLRMVRAHARARGGASSSGDVGAGGLMSERLALEQAPAEARDLHRIWSETGGILDERLLTAMDSQRGLETACICGVRGSRLAVSYVGPRLRLPEGLTRERALGMDLLEIHPERGFGAMVAAHYAVCAHERRPIVHHVSVNRQRDYRRIALPLFNPSGRSIVGVRGESKAPLPAPAPAP